MFNPSNLYAEKVFAEYPLELWSLDDATDYVSLITEQQRNLTTWTVSRTGIGSTAVTVTDVTSTFNEEDAPLQESSIYKIVTNPTASFSTATITLTSDTTFDLKNETEFAIGLPILADPYTTGIRVGFKVGSTITWSNSYPAKSFIWSSISNTFSLEDPLSGPANMVFEITFGYSGTSGSTYTFYVNGISAGIRLEEFYSVSTGITPEVKPSNFPITTSSVMVYRANPYSLSDNYGYYTVDDGIVLRARNSTVPLVYGASNSTILSQANSGNPSLVIPGQGFLNESGKTFTRTFECWIRLNSSATTYRRILGPVSPTSKDGLYVNGPFMSLKIGDNMGSYFVGEWSRPMLIQIITQEDSAVLKVNAETVITLKLTLKDQTLEAGTNDWIGFYAYSDVTQFEVDCVAIYPYVVSDKIAKKRYVYGQGVVLPESTNTSYGGSSIVIDYSFADYDKNHSFPKDVKWSSGVVRNLYTDSERISLPKYSLPTANFGNNTFNEWLAVMQDAHQDTEITDTGRGFFYMKPTYYIDGSSSSFFDLGYPYFSFDNLNILNNSRLAGMYFIFKNNTAISPSDQQTLFYVEDYLTGKKFEVCASSEDITYFINGEVVHTDHVRDEGGTQVMAVAGINIDIFKNTSPDAFALFSDPSRLTISIGGSKFSTSTGDKTFTGPIYEIGFLSPSDIANVPELFTSSGYTDFTAVDGFKAITPAYKMVGTYILDTFNLDIAASGYWEDYVPLSIFKKELELEDGTKIDDVSMIQVNLDYPVLNKFIDNDYDTSSSLARFYVSFQNMADGVILSENRTAVSANKNGVVMPGSSWQTEKYEIVDGTIVAMPTVTDIDEVSMIIGMDISSNALSSSPIVIRSIELSSLTFDEQSLRPIGTKYGTKVYPFKEIEDESYVSSKSNYFKIYKGTTPYLYLTSKTGISVVGDVKAPSDPGYVHRGIVANINQDLAAQYDVSSIMMSIRYQDKLFPQSKIPVFEMEGHLLSGGSIKNAYLRFYLESVNTSNTRGRIFCEANIDNTGFAPYEDIVYYWNGNIVGYPQISSGEWGMLAISFTNFVKFPGVAGTFEILGKLLVDNVSIYKLSETTSSASTTINTWNTSLYGSGTWENVMDTDGFETPTNNTSDDNLWFDTYSVIKTSTKPVDQTEIYRSYLGTNKIIVDTTDSLIAIRPESCEYILYNAVEWKTTVLNAL